MLISDYEKEFDINFTSLNIDKVYDFYITVSIENPGDHADYGDLYHI